MQGPEVPSLPPSLGLGCPHPRSPKLEHARPQTPSLSPEPPRPRPGTAPPAGRARPLLLATKAGAGGWKREWEVGSPGREARGARRLLPELPGPRQLPRAPLAPQTPTPNKLGAARPRPERASARQTVPDLRRARGASHLPGPAPPSPRARRSRASPPLSRRVQRSRPLPRIQKSPPRAPRLPALKAQAPFVCGPRPAPRLSPRPRARRTPGQPPRTPRPSAPPPLPPDVASAFGPARDPRLPPGRRGAMPGAPAAPCPCPAPAPRPRAGLSFSHPRAPRATRCPPRTHPPAAGRLVRPPRSPGAASFRPRCPPQPGCAPLPPRLRPASTLPAPRLPREPRLIINQASFHEAPGVCGRPAPAGTFGGRSHSRGALPLLTESAQSERPLSPHGRDGRDEARGGAWLALLARNSLHRPGVLRASCPQLAHLDGLREVRWERLGPFGV